MTEGLERILRRYGQDVAVNGRPAKAFFQMAAGSEKQEPQTATALGAVDRRLWSYVGRTEVRPGDRVTFRERNYAVRSAQAVRVGEEVSHWQAVLTAEREAAE